MGNAFCCSNPEDTQPGDKDKKAGGCGGHGHDHKHDHAHDHKHDHDHAHDHAHNATDLGKDGKTAGDKTNSKMKTFNARKR